MGLFSKNVKTEKNVKKYCEIIYSDDFKCFGKEDCRTAKEKAISDRIEQGRIIKDIKIDRGEILILYDYEAEERRRQEELEKQNSKDAWTQKLENDKNNSNGWER